MAKWPGIGGGGGFDYVQTSAPSNPEVGEEWADTTNSPTSIEAKLWDGDEWHSMTVGQFSELAGKIAASQIPADVIDGTKVAADAIAAGHIAAGAVGSSELAANAVGATQLDGSYPDGSIGAVDLSFDPASQTELDNHAATGGAHHSRPTGTNTYTGAGGWREIIALSSTENITERTYGVYASSLEIYWENDYGSSQSVTVDVYYCDGTSDQFSESIAANETASVTRAVPDSKGIWEISWSQSGGSGLRTRVKGYLRNGPEHSHGI